MRKLIKPSGVDAEILDTHDIFIDVVDSMGRNHKFLASPKRGGVLCYFDTLSEFRKWCRQVTDIRAMQRGELTTLEKAVNYLFTQDIEPALIQKILISC